MKTTRVHHAARRRGGGVAARGGGAAAWADAAHRRAHEPGRGRSGRAGPRRSVSARAAGIRLGRRPQRADRYRWGASNRGRPHAQIRGGIGGARAGRHPGHDGDIALALQQATRTVPIVFATVTDPVGAGLVESLARPGGNATGFITFEYGISAKWLELLKEIAPGVTRAAVIREPTVAGIGQIGAMQAVAPSFGVELSPVDVRDASEIERALADFARASNSGLIVTASTSSIAQRERIVTLAARHRLPAIYPSRRDAAVGGLISYGPDVIDQYRRAAGYVNRVLKGEKPADLPVQAPTKYELVINLKTAKALGLDVPANAARPRRRGDRMIAGGSSLPLLGGAAAAWPLTASAQQSERVRRLGVLVGLAEHDPEAKARLAGFWQTFERLGWFEGRNVLVDYRYAPAGRRRAQKS